MVVLVEEMVVLIWGFKVLIYDNLLVFGIFYLYFWDILVLSVMILGSKKNRFIWKYMFVDEYFSLFIWELFILFSREGCMILEEN